MTDQTHDIAAKDFSRETLVELFDQMADSLQGNLDTDLRLKALDRALSYQAIHAKEGISSPMGTREIASAFLAFLKGE